MIYKIKKNKKMITRGILKKGNLIDSYNISNQKDFNVFLVGEFKNKNFEINEYHSKDLPSFDEHNYVGEFLVDSEIYTNNENEKIEVLFKYFIYYIIDNYDNVTINYLPYLIVKSSYTNDELVYGLNDDMLSFDDFVDAVNTYDDLDDQIDDIKKLINNWIKKIGKDKIAKIIEGVITSIIKEYKQNEEIIPTFESYMMSK